MTFNEIVRDVQALEEELNSYERKYNVLSETFYESYLNGEEPADDAWVLDWNDWAGLYEIWLERHQQYSDLIRALKQQTSLSELIKRAAHREPISLPS
ncbi:MAG: hypothetical protein KC423_21175 [Anaerolineales bacterium]|nr:hypothetical protein [Anaerolineales bacterium]